MKTKNTVEIIPFSIELSSYVKALNYEWLEKYFKVEKGDVISLSNPQTEIINKGGFIYFAKLNNEIVGTVSLLKKSDTVFELGKMAVTEKAQGLGIGKLLVEYCLTIAKEKNIETNLPKINASETSEQDYSLEFQREYETKEA